MTDWTSPSATLALSLITPCVGALLGCLLYSCVEYTLRIKRARKTARQRWKGLLS